MQSLQAILILLFTFNLACSSSGFKRDNMYKDIKIRANHPADPETKDINDILKIKPNLPKPYKLAVYMKQPRYFYNSPKWRWTKSDRENLFKSIKSSPQGKNISEIIPIFEFIADKKDVKSLRRTAAKHGADALLVVSGAADIDNYADMKAWSYLLVLPAFFVKAVNFDTLFISSAALYDVRNGFLYSTQQEEVEQSFVNRPFEKTKKEMLQSTKQQALKIMVKEALF